MRQVKEGHMNIANLGEYDELYAACSRLDDARLTRVSIDTSSSTFILELSFDVTANTSTPFKRFSLHCHGLEAFQFQGQDLNQFMMMSGYPDSLFIRVEGAAHAIYLLPNGAYPSNGQSIEEFELRATCTTLHWSAQ
jgi:hypothetical protein